jgi:hypothetical protein
MRSTRQSRVLPLLAEQLGGTERCWTSRYVGKAVDALGRRIGFYLRDINFAFFLVTVQVQKVLFAFLNPIIACGLYSILT